MSLTLTLKSFAHRGDLAQIPSMELSANQPDYWILLPVFEKIEEKTGKLIDLGESQEFDIDQCSEMKTVIKDELVKLKKEVNEDTLLERDDEIRMHLLEKIENMVQLAIKFETPFLALVN